MLQISIWEKVVHSSPTKIKNNNYRKVPISCKVQLPNEKLKLFTRSVTVKCGFDGFLTCMKWGGLWSRYNPTACFAFVPSQEFQASVSLLFSLSVYFYVSGVYIRATISLQLCMTLFRSDAACLVVWVFLVVHWNSFCSVENTTGKCKAF